MQIQNCVKKKVYAIKATATVQDAIVLFDSHHISLMPVLDEDNRPIGLVGSHGLLELALPSTIHPLDIVDFIGDFGAVETYQPSGAVPAKPITKPIRLRIFVQSEISLFRAILITLQHDLHNMPVVDAAGRLIGIAHGWIWAR
jgi:CBS-domain-containing membrane protein